MKDEIFGRREYRPAAAACSRKKFTRRITVAWLCYMRTIFISSFHSLISRNILATSLMDRLLTADRELTIVILCPRRKSDIFREEFGRDRVICEGIPLRLYRGDLYMRALALSALRTRSLKIKRVTELAGRGSLLSFLLANSAGRIAVRFLNRFLTPRGTFDALFARYHPAIVFSTDIQNELDVRLMRDARRHGTSVVGMVRSWDNLTAKGLIRFVPDFLVVHNEIIAREAMRLHGIRRKRLRVIGIPHYDRYIERIALGVDSRAAFLHSIGADPHAKLVLYAPAGDRYVANNTVDCEVLWILDEAVRGVAHILVRHPVADTVNCMHTYPSRRHISIERLSKERYQSRKDIELTAEDDMHLQEVLAVADVVVAGPSTISIDAALFGKPVILVGFDGNTPRPYHESIRRYYDYDHFVPVRASGGVVLAESPNALVSVLRAYLARPARDHEARQKLIEEQSWRLDGRASERLVAVLKEFLP